jgi:YidC/Oxa1 family membrane protein insertase
MFIFANVIQSAFAPLITLFESILVFIHNDVVGGSWGLAIVGLTVVIRAIMVPLTYRQLKSMQAMQALAPEMQAIKEKYKEDKQRQQQELMKFYQENKINPLASCLPLILQLPVFISLFYMLRTDLKKHICGNQLVTAYNQAHTHHMVASAGAKASAFTKYIEKTSCNTVAPHSAKFLFLPDITNKATGVALIVLIVLYVGSQLFSTLIATATADANQRRLMLLLPVVFVVILYRYPAGLLVYWITTNLWTIVQQTIIKRRLPPPPKRDPSTAASNGKPTRSLRQTIAAAAAPRTPGVAGAGAAAGAASGPAATPPRPPRKKKKRSGRRR